MKIKAAFFYMIVLIVWHIFLYYRPDKTTEFNYLYNLGYAVIFFSTALLSVYTFLKPTFRNAVGKAILFLGLGQASYGIGLVIWTYYNIVLHVEIPYPSVADVFFIVFFSILMAYGCLSLLKIYTPFISKKSLLEALGIFILSGVFIYAINKPDVSNNLAPLVRITNIAYPLVDTLLLSLAFITLRISGGKVKMGMATLVFGFMLQVAADLFYTYRTAHELYWNGDVSDMIYTISGTVILIAIIKIIDQFEAPAR